MKKTVFAILSFIAAAAMIISAVSCTKSRDDALTDTETKAKTTEAITQTDNLPEDVTDEITAEDITADAITTGETTAEEVTADKITETETEQEKSNEAYLLYKTATEKTNALSDLKQNVTVDQNMVMTVLGEQTESLTKQTMKCEYHDRYGDGMKCRAVSEVYYVSNGQSQTTETEVIMDKDTVYYKTGDSDVYTSLSRSDPNAAAFDSMITTDSMTTRMFSEDVFRYAAVTENGDGSKTVSVSPEEDAMKSALGKAAEQLKQVYSALGAEDVVYTPAGAELSFTVSADGYIIHIELKMTIGMSMTISGYRVTATSESVSVVDTVDPGQTVIIEIPSI